MADCRETDESEVREGHRRMADASASRNRSVLPTGS